MRVSACLITRNEEKNIERCLTSLPNNVDEIVILDGFSKDKTVQIARKFGARVFQRKFSGSYSDERNYCASLAENDWILMLDADEVFDKLLRRELERITSKPQEKYSMYCCPRKTIRAGKFIFSYYSYPNFKPVLFNRKKCVYIGAVHEILKVDGKRKFIRHHIIHYKERAKNTGPMQVRYNALAKKTKYKITRSAFESAGNAWFIFRAMLFGLGLYKSIGGWRYTFGYLLHLLSKRNSGPKKRR